MEQHVAGETWTASEAAKAFGLAIHQTRHAMKTALRPWVTYTSYLGAHDVVKRVPVQKWQEWAQNRPSVGHPSYPDSVRNQRKRRREEVYGKIMEILQRANKPMTVTEISEALGYHESSGYIRVSKPCLTLVMQGKLKQTFGPNGNAYHI